jgi:glycosyltransferase involved in cell wall biosynthesis
MQPLISIALCTYNGAKYLQEQLMSIINQTYKNIEIVVVDDCSTDHTVDLVKSLEKTFPQIKLYQNENNLGFNKNFEKAIELTTGDYIAISDQDDIWELNKLEFLFNHIGDNWLIFSNSVFIDEQNNDLGKTLLQSSFKLGERDFRSLLFYNFVTGHTTLFARTFIPYIFPIPSSGFYDWWMGFIALYHKKIAYLNKNLTLHRIHSTSVMFQDSNIDADHAKKNHFNEVLNNLAILKTYKNLTETDRELIYHLHGAYGKIATGKYNSFLFNQIFKSYKDFFPDLKTRNLISRFNFAYKFSKGI